MRPALGTDDISDFLTALARLHLHGTGDEIVACLSFPIAYYLPEQVLVFTEADKLAERFTAHQAYLKVCRVTTIEARAIKILDATPDRALTQLEWHYLSADGKTLRQSDVQYVLRRAKTEIGFCIELVDYSRLGFPQYLHSPSAQGRA